MLDSLHGSEFLPVFPLPIQQSTPINDHLDLIDDLELDPTLSEPHINFDNTENNREDSEIFAPIEALAHDILEEATNLVDDFATFFASIQVIDDSSDTYSSTISSTTPSPISTSDKSELLGFLSDIHLHLDSDTDDDNMGTTPLLTAQLLNDLRQSQNNNAQALIDGLSNLNARALLSDIPQFSGNDQEQVIEEWFKIAERVANTAGWTNTQKLNLFQQRLTKSAANFNDSLTPAQKVDYQTWKNEITTGLQDTTAKAIRKEQLKYLKQLPNERVRDFQIRIDDNYKIAYGVGPATSTNANVTTLRNDVKKDVLLKGLKPEIATMVWSRIHPDDRYEIAVQRAIACEKLVEVQKISANQDLTSAVTVISKENEKNADDIKELKNLVQELVKTTISPKPIAGLEAINDPAVIAAFNQFQSNNQGRGRVRFLDDRRSRSVSPRRTSGYQSNKYYNSANRFKQQWDEQRRCFYCNRVGHIARQCRRQQTHPYNRQGNRRSVRFAQTGSKE